MGVGGLLFLLVAAWFMLDPPWPFASTSSSSGTLKPSYDSRGIDYDDGRRRSYSYMNGRRRSYAIESLTTSYATADTFTDSPWHAKLNPFNWIRWIGEAIDAFFQWLKQMLTMVLSYIIGLAVLAGAMVIENPIFCPHGPLITVCLQGEGVKKSRRRVTVDTVYHEAFWPWESDWVEKVTHVSGKY